VWLLVGGGENFFCTFTYDRKSFCVMRNSSSIYCEKAKLCEKTDDKEVGTSSDRHRKRMTRIFLIAENADFIFEHELHE